jgi:hypothetical protein
MFYSYCRGRYIMPYESGILHCHVKACKRIFVSEKTLIHLH